MSEQDPWRGIRPWQRHSLVLLVAGLVYLMIGLSAIFIDPTPAREKALQFAANWWDLETWGVIFALAGILSIVSARWPPVSETWGYTVLTGLSALWSGFYLMGIVLGNSPVSNVAGVLSWGLIAFLWWAIAGLVNPLPEIPLTPKAVDDDGRDELS